ncbi:MAG: hypothetical protein WD555_03680 [Fulvivirga sp.]
MKKTAKFFMVIMLGSFFTFCGGEKNNTEKSSLNNKSKWQAMDVKDDFGDIVQGESVIGAQFKGTMSNSAVAGVDLTVSMQLQDSIIFSTFYEYNKEPIAQLPDSEFLTIKVKVSNGDVLEAKQFLFQNMMVDSDKELLNILLGQDKPVKVIADISQADKYSTKVYNFEIDPNGLNEIIK